MRKRKYSQLDSIDNAVDHLLEDVDDYYKQHEGISREECPPLQIHNLVGTGMVSTSSGVLDLHSMVIMIPNCSYHKQKFAAITIRLTQPCCTALLFTSGKMVLTGCKTYIECIDCALQVVDMLRNTMRALSFRLESVRVQNMVGNVSLPAANSRLDLLRMQKENNIYCTYQKKMFPGLIFRPASSPIVLLLFCSGKIVVTGGKSVNDMKVGWKKLWGFVKDFIME
jgi:transcription initiation factor TFIID TATA-box-binding protein